MSGMTSQPSIGALINAVKGTPLETGIDPKGLGPLATYWDQARGLYAPFESGLKSGTSDVYEHEMPGGQYTNLKFQAMQNGLGAEWDAVKEAYAAANRLMGNIVKVTPSSKVVGDLTQFIVANNLTEESLLEEADTLSFPSSVVDFMQGYLGVPEGGFPEPAGGSRHAELPLERGGLHAGLPGRARGRVPRATAHEGAQGRHAHRGAPGRVSAPRGPGGPQDQAPGGVREVQPRRARRDLRRDVPRRVQDVPDREGPVRRPGLHADAPVPHPHEGGRGGEHRGGARGERADQVQGRRGAAFDGGAGGVLRGQRHPARRGRAGQDPGGDDRQGEEREGRPRRDRQRGGAHVGQRGRGPGQGR